MKPRARRVTIAAAASVAALVAVLTVACWSTVRDHVEAWHFQLTRETWTMKPDQGLKIVEGEKWVPGAGMNAPALFGLIARHSGIPVAYDPLASPEHFHYRAEYPDLTSQCAIRRLESSGYRVLKQCFPRRVYVLIRVNGPGRRSLYEVPTLPVGYPGRQ